MSLVEEGAWTVRGKGLLGKGMRKEEKIRRDNVEKCSFFLIQNGTTAVVEKPLWAAEKEDDA